MKYHEVKSFGNYVIVQQFQQSHLETNYVIESQPLYETEKECLVETFQIFQKLSRLEKSDFRKFQGNEVDRREGRIDFDVSPEDYPIILYYYFASYKVLFGRLAYVPGEHYSGTTLLNDTEHTVDKAGNHHTFYMHVDNWLQKKDFLETQKQKN